MIELARRAAIVVLWLRVALGVLVGEFVKIVNSPLQSRPLTSSTPRGLEWRSIKRVGPRVIAFRMQVIVCQI
jgi:hypothetical protein